MTSFIPGLSVTTVKKDCADAYEQDSGNSRSILTA